VPTEHLAQLLALSFRQLHVGSLLIVITAMFPCDGKLLRSQSKV
jgi:hypothetical protein